MELCMMSVTVFLFPLKLHLNYFLVPRGMFSATMFSFDRWNLTNTF